VRVGLLPASRTNRPVAQTEVMGARRARILRLRCHLVRGPQAFAPGAEMSLSRESGTARCLVMGAMGIEDTMWAAAIVAAAARCWQAPEDVRAGWKQA
jgi:hypothetical protein